jgi:hypothetical protein
MDSKKEGPESHGVDCQNQLGLRVLS